jgi:hypothetical protein
MLTQVVHIFCHRYPPESIPAFIAVLFLPPTILHFTSFLSLSVPHFVESLAVYLFFLGCSVSLYRLSPFHPLAKYPGPALARISRLWAVRHVLGGYRHKVSRELFEKYGDIVRTGPDHLIVRDASAIPVVLGAKNPWHKHGREYPPSRAHVFLVLTSRIRLQCHPAVRIRGRPPLPHVAVRAQ